ncbi:hypothetical protein VRU48_09080 [Pedobacter sp. KR3-3]|uniref:Uncharacterized protein n=1 Tax=Pedobacter albus TaxID=3113905 RepID=A0ABU7I720_9SPHI|nr:hypothetical protein [Pedobacter sp. KR3-3]MEE1945260.1 hypothetical protein [Pedobacter sp. KR3-3]
MKKIIFLLSLALSIVVAEAQEAPPQVPPKKNVIDAKLPQLPTKLPLGTVKELPTLADRETAKFTLYTWKLTRMWVTGNIGHSVSDVAFKFLVGGQVSCSLWTPEAMTSLQAGSYRINGNNLSIVLKKDANVTMTCSLIYNSSNKTLTGTYVLQVLPIANQPTAYMPGTVNGEIRLEIKP